MFLIFFYVFKYFYQNFEKSLKLYEFRLCFCNKRSHITLKYFSSDGTQDYTFEILFENAAIIFSKVTEHFEEI